MLNNLPKLPRTFRHFDRLRRTMSIIFRHGFGYFFWRMRSLVPWRDRPGKGSDKALPERLRQVLIELGPTYVKLGQIFSGRSDILPATYIKELAKLQDRLPSFPFEQVRKIFRDEFGKEIEQLFSEFSPEPLAAASIAQGHLAKLLDGQEVFVKIRRPGIEKDVVADLEIAELLARHLERTRPDLAYLHLPRLVEEFANSMLDELDLTTEAANMDCFRRQFEGRHGLKVPKIYHDICSHRVLTMEYIHGHKGTDLEALRAANIDLKAVSSLGADLLLEQFFVHGFFHADPHPGNIFILDDGSICYIDFGQMGRISRDEREYFAELLAASVQNDEKTCAYLLLKLCTWDEEPNMDDLERGVSAFIDKYIHLSIEEIDVSKAVLDIYRLCRQKRLSLKPHIYLMLKALSVSDDMGRGLNPEFSVLAQLKPFVAKAVLRKLEPTNLWRKFSRYGREYLDTVTALPTDYRQFVHSLLGGNLHFAHRLDGLEQFRKAYSHGVNRLCFAILQLGLLIGSAIVIHARIAPLVCGISLLGILAFLVSCCLCAIMLVDAWRNR